MLPWCALYTVLKGHLKSDLPEEWGGGGREGRGGVEEEEGEDMGGGGRGWIREMPVTICDT